MGAKSCKRAGLIFQDSYRKSFFSGLLFIYLSIIGCSNTASFLYDFETEADLDRLVWECGTSFSISEEHVTSGHKSLKIVLFPASVGSNNSYPGLGLSNFDSNWSKYHALQCNIFNPESRTLQIVIRIDDKSNPPYDDRLNKNVTLYPGANTVTVPFSELVTSGTLRNLNLKNIESVILFLVSPQNKHVLFVDNLHIR